MAKSYNGKILHIDLLDKTFSVEYPEKKDKNFYRRYWGGSCIGAYYLIKKFKRNTDVYSPENLLIFATSVVTGANVPGFCKFSVISKSPLTNLASESFSDGFWGPELKFAGYDVIVVKGISNKPVYISIINGQVKFNDANDIWGMETKETIDTIKKKLNDKAVRVACIGPAGENKVRFASIVSDYIFMNARGGLGAVMGSKKLKAIAVRGNKIIDVEDKAGIKRLAQKFEQNFKKNFVNKAVYEAGTASFLSFLNGEGLISSRNAQTTEFEGAKKISGEIIQKKYFSRRVKCYSCPASCHRLLKSIEGIGNDPNYGAPELEILMSLGNGCNIDDLEVIIKANELCNRFGLDPTSLGVTIAFAMECFEKGLLKEINTDGIKLKFGNAEIITDLIQKIAFRTGIGELLAEGTKILAQKIGNNSMAFAMQIKGLEIPLHDPRTKAMLGLSYLLSPIGPDDLAVEHDTDFDFNAPELFLERVKTLGLFDQVKADDLGFKKIRMLCYLQQVFSFMDSLCLCKFAFSPCRYYTFSDMVEIINCITGWEVSLWELMKVGERRLNMYQVFNLLEGYNITEENIPKRVYEPIASGPKKGSCISREDLNNAKNFYYLLRDWDRETGKPSFHKLEELDLGWLNKLW